VILKAGQNLIAPTVGMTFESKEQAYEMYNNYAGKVGFSILERARQSTAKMVVYVRNL
jgi:zinc finger SWIM domain-containing protein 3